MSDRSDPKTSATRTVLAAVAAVEDLHLSEDCDAGAPGFVESLVAFGEAVRDLQRFQWNDLRDYLTDKYATSWPPEEAGMVSEVTDRPALRPTVPDLPEPSNGVVETIPGTQA